MDCPWLPIGQATESELTACVGHLLICQVTKCAVSSTGICQLCPHGPLSWSAFQTAEGPSHLVLALKFHAKKIITRLEHLCARTSGQR